MKEAFAKWKLEHPTAYKRTLLVLGGFVLALLLVGWIQFARAANATLVCADGQTPTWTQSTATLACPATGGGGPVDPPPVVTPPPQGGPFTGCPSGTLTIDNPWGNTAIDTAVYGAFTNNIVSVRLVAPTNMNGTKTSSWSEFGSAPTTREAVFSTKPCSFDNAFVLKNAYSQFAHKLDVVSFNFQYRLGTAQGFTLGIAAGTPYYINIRNKNSSGVDTCTTPDCRMRGGLPQ